MKKLDYPEVYYRAKINTYLRNTLVLEDTLKKSNKFSVKKKFEIFFDKFHNSQWKEFVNSTSPYRRRLLQKFIECETSAIINFTDSDDFIEDFINNDWAEITNQFRNNLNTPLEQILSKNKIEVVKHLAECIAIENLYEILNRVKCVNKDTPKTIIARLRNKEKILNAEQTGRINKNYENEKESNPVLGLQSLTFKKMEINGLVNIQPCRFCAALIPVGQIKCDFCKKDLTYIIPEKFNDINYQGIKTLLADAFFRLENFMNGTKVEYKYFGFNDAFTKLFAEVQKEENYKSVNHKLIGKYFQLIEQINHNIDKGEYNNLNAHGCENFNKDIDEIELLSSGRYGEFSTFITLDDIAEYNHKYSISDVTKSEIELPKRYKTKIQNPILQQPKKTLTSTVLKYKSYLTLYHHLNTVEKLTHKEAIKKIIEKYGTSEKTIERALKMF